MNIPFSDECLDYIKVIGLAEATRICQEAIERHIFSQSPSDTPKVKKLKLLSDYQGKGALHDMPGVVRIGVRDYPEDIFKELGVNHGAGV